VGPYTAAAVASIAYGARVAAVDTNVRRVVARARLGVEPDRVTPASVRTHADRWLPSDRAGDWNQALMDLGRELCRPVPRCGSCPLRPSCRLEAAGRVGVGLRARPAAEPFAGSMRQVRGSVIRTLRERPAATVRVLARASGRSPAVVATAVAALAAEGMVEASREAMDGEPSGEVRLAEGSA
jgi:A/G-specific adenine glycosylase